MGGHELGHGTKGGMRRPMVSIWKIKISKNPHPSLQHHLLRCNDVPPGVPPTRAMLAL